MDLTGAGTTPAVEHAALALHDTTLSADEVLGRLAGLVEALGLGDDACVLPPGAPAPDGVKAIPVVPPRGEVAALLVCRPASAEAVTRLEALAAHAGVALHYRVRLAEVEHREGTVRRVAEHLQDALLPPLPPLEHTAVARRYVPAMRDTRVGGDFYDVFALPDGRTLLVVGDVVGKGIEAASRTSQITQTLRALALQDLPLDELLRLCDTQVTFQDPDIMATVWCGLYDDRTGELTFSSLGHPPALLLRGAAGANPTPIRLELSGLPLGMGDLAPTELECRNRQLSSGDLLVCYTDGVVETAGDFLTGQDALLQAVEDHRLEPLDALLDHAMTDLLADANHRDDALMLALRRR